MKATHLREMRESGFTLIEVLIAIVILALMMISVYSMINNSATTKDVIINEDRRLMQLQAALSRFDLDFSALTSPLFYTAVKGTNNDQANEMSDNFGAVDDGRSQPFEPSENFYAVSEAGHLIPTFQMPDGETIIFFTSSHYRRVENIKQSRYVWVRYTLRDGTRSEDQDSDAFVGKEWVRQTITEDIYRPEFDWTKEKEFVLLSRLKEFKWGFWDKERERFVENMRELANPNVAPRLVQVQMVWVAPDDTEVEITRTFRPLSPFFDVAAEAKLLKAKASQAANGGSTLTEDMLNDPPPMDQGGDDDL